MKAALAALLLVSCADRGSILAFDDTGDGGSGDAQNTAPESGSAPLAIVLVDTTSPPHADDPRLEARLRMLGFTVQERPQTMAVGSGDNAALVVVSSSAESAGLNATLPDQPTPIVLLESFAYSKFGMTGPVQGQDFGVIDDTTVDVVDPTLSGLPLGSVIVYTQATTLNYAQPAPSAIVAAWVHGTTNRAATFGYLAGSMMVSRTAPARRVGVFLRTGTTGVAAPEGWVMFDSAVRWAVQ